MEYEASPTKGGNVQTEARPLVRGRIWSRIRMPLMAAALVGLFSGLAPGRWVGVGGLAFGLALYSRLGTPRSDAVDLASPIAGRWLAMNSPTSRVPSHGIHAWSQTYAVDLVHDPEEGSRPGMAWWPMARSPRDFPAFGQPVHAPCDGQVVASVGWLRDHRSRTSPPALVYLLLESVRELLGPWAILGNHVVVRRDDGVFVLMAHLRRKSLRVRRGDIVEKGQQVAECGNSGNSTEPHVHLQAMDRESTWIAAGIPFTLDGSDLPPSGEHLQA